LTICPNDYLLYGGMPYILNLQDEEEKAKYLVSLHNEIYMKDISERCLNAYGVCCECKIRLIDMFPQTAPVVDPAAFQRPSGRFRSWLAGFASS
jgi:hypothetical protein